MIEEAKEFNNDVLHLLRAVMKISSAFNNLDVLTDEKKYIKFDLKLEVNEWSKAILGTTSKLMKSLVAENDNLFMEIYNSLEELDSRVHMKNRPKRHLIIFYVKLKSAMNDLNKITKHNWMDSIIMYYTKKVVSRIESMYKPIISITDVDGISIDDFINFYDECGTRIMYTGEIKNE